MKTFLNNMINKIGVLTVILFTMSCSSDDFQKLDQRNWQLVWADEFNEAAGTLPNSANWTYDLGNGLNGWGNQELQSYTNNPENVSMDGDGNLVITALRSGTLFTSARIKTQGLFSQKYGRFEARIITPYGPGLWPAFWMLGDNIETVNWPQCGEIDIMELRGQEPNAIAGSLHGPGYSAGNAISKKYVLSNSRFDTDYHLYAVEWDADKIDFFVDGYLYNRIERGDVPGEWVYDNPFFLILNIAVGGNYVGFPTTQTPFPQRMIIDYVRVYQEVK
ncbi:MAG: glycoside hydrolase family 16 protein [Saprospiraceae bacterium]|nr:glycoside hydrolase family 16 protein [Saprospiraceae bacterium]